jgi:hypothetical protein
MMWRKSSKSQATSDCVEVRGDLRAFRDSKAPHESTVVVSATGYAGFLGALKDGRLDRGR